MSNRIRRSNYSYKVIGRKIRIYPMPTAESVRYGTKLWIRVQFVSDPLNPSISDSTINGVSNTSNIPFGNLTYSKINSIGRQWTRQYTLALCRELLGLIRSKFTSVPIPGSDLTLNGSDLVTQGRDDKEKLITQIREMLETMTYDKLIEKEASSAENLTKVLSKIPVPNGMAIRMG